MNFFNKLAIICFLMVVLVEYRSGQGNPPPSLLDVDVFGRAFEQYYLRQYSTPENPKVTYNSNLPQDLRAKYVGKTRTPQVFTDVCSKSADSGYYCVGAVGDIPPIHQRYYFDYYTQTCRCLLYNGCDGNANNFMSLDQCQDWCETNVTIAKRRTIKDQLVYIQNEAQCLYFY